MPAPAYCRPAAYAAFAAELPHVETTRGLFRGAYAIALHERPEADAAEGEATIDDLANLVRRRVRSPNPEAMLAHLHDVLFDVVGLRGNVDDYYSPANSYLPDVLRTRRGLPITLTLIYKCVAEGVGLTVHGINAPGHFIAAVECEGRVERGEMSEKKPMSLLSPLPSRLSTPLMYVDPFYGGGLLTEEDVFERIVETTGREVSSSRSALARATGRQWLERMLLNLQAAFATLGRERDLLAMQELAALL
jgi:regulator of sirC expression with transglutaminase-like and TPR domain